MAMPSKDRDHPGTTKRKKAVRFADPPIQSDSESSSSGFDASMNALQHHKCTERDEIKPYRDPELYCIGRRSSLPEQESPQHLFSKCTTKADGSPIQSILKKGTKPSTYASALSTSDTSLASLASNPWNLSLESHDLFAPLIPQRHASEDADISTDDSLGTLGAEIPTKQRRESNRDAFLRQFLKKKE
ncbi:MAG: hypothetical protein SGBAC_008341 [Bacillariaceae sp.]